MNMKTNARKKEQIANQYDEKTAEAHVKTQ